MRPLIISHAGCAGHAPENTLAGVRAALRLGADAVEVDVRATADGVPVLMHDPAVDRTTNGSGAIARMMLTEVRTLDAGGGEPVPLLAEVLALTRGNALLVVEIKELGVERPVAELIRRAQALSDVMIWSFLPQAIDAVGREEPRLPCGLLIAAEGLPIWPHLRDWAHQSGLQAVSVFHEGITEEMVRQAQDSALAIYGWTVDTKEEMTRLIDLGVNGIVTNYPERAVALLKTYGCS